MAGRHGHNDFSLYLDVMLRPLLLENKVDIKASSEFSEDKITSAVLRTQTEVTRRLANKPEPAAVDYSVRIRSRITVARKIGVSLSFRLQTNHRRKSKKIY